MRGGACFRVTYVSASPIVCVGGFSPSAGGETAAGVFRSLGEGWAGSDASPAPRLSSSRLLAVELPRSEEEGKATHPYNQFTVFCGTAGADKGSSGDNHQQEVAKGRKGQVVAAHGERPFTIRAHQRPMQSGISPSALADTMSICLCPLAPVVSQGCSLWVYPSASPRCDTFRVPLGLTSVFQDSI